jgi:thioredoxin-dependent peroxiredoxin
MTKTKRFLCTAAGAAALASLLLTATAGAFAEPPPVGSDAPDFSLTTNEGKTASLKEFRGKWVVLYFYPKDFTSGCTMQARNFQRDLAEFEKRNAVVLGVSVDTAESHKSFCAKEGLAFKLLSDEGGKVSDTYGSVMEYNGAKYSARNTFLIDPQGKIAKVYLKANPVSNSQDVLKDLTALQEKK